MTRTIIRNIRLMSANAVTTITTNSRNRRIGSSGFGMPATRLPMITMIETPASTALIVPEMLKPATSSSFVMGVTR